MAEKSIAEPQRKAVFLALVEAQDQGMKVAASRKEIAKRFGLNEMQVKQIEQEGLDKEWPPL